MPKKKKRLWAVVLCLLLVIATVLPSVAASASTTTSSSVSTKTKIDGRVDVSFDYKTGVLSASYKNGNVSSVTYSWISSQASSSSTSSSTKTTTSTSKTNSSQTTYTGRLYTAPSAGVYQCIVSPTDTSSATGTVESLEIKIYSVAVDSFITLNSPKGLYKAGDRVRAKAKTDGVIAKDWSSNIDGLSLPSSGNTAVFNMPAANVTLTCTAPSLHTIKMTGGTANTYSAAEGAIVTVKASKYAGKTFQNWVPSGCTLLDATKESTSFTMPDADVTIEASFTDSSASTGSAATVDVSSYTSTTSFTDPSRVKYSVTQTNNYKVRMYHAKLGPNYDKFFKLAAGKDTLVTDYFTIIINDNKNIAAIPGPVTIQLTLPRDIQKTDRTFRMVCITRDGKSYSFADQDDDDATVTFTPDRFFAFALCYNDWQAAYRRQQEAAAEAAAQQAEAQAAAEATQEQLDEAKNEGYQQGLADGQAQAAASASSSSPAPSEADYSSTDSSGSSGDSDSTALITSEIRPASQSQTQTLTGGGTVPDDTNTSGTDNYSPASSQGLTTQGGTAMPAAKPPVVEL